MENLEIDKVNSNIYETVEKFGVKTYRSTKLETTSFYVPCDKISDDSNITGYISEGLVSVIENKFYGEYIIKKYEYINPYIYNDKIKGVAIEGKIKRVPYSSGNSLGIAAVTIDFNDGVVLKAKQLMKENSDYVVSSRNDYIMVNHKIKRQLFPYVTPYSQTKTGFFCTPEVGDNVLVYFGTNIESDGYVIGSIKNDKSIRFSNPFERNYITTSEEMELFGELDGDMGEANNVKNMLESVETSVNKLVNISFNNDKYSIFVKSVIAEESKSKSSILHEIFSITAKESYNLSADNINISASNYVEQADTKKEKVDSKTGIYNSKEEAANKVTIVANTHNINVRKV